MKTRREVQPPSIKNDIIMKERIEQWKRMAAAGSPEADMYLEKITAEAKAEGKSDEMAEVLELLIANANAHLDNIEKSVEQYTLHQQMGSLSEVINLAYIARHYFGKTRQWLYQRLKGQTVNGKPASFTPEEQNTFRAALDEIGLQIAAFTHRG